MVVAELGALRPVEKHRPRRGVYRLGLGSRPGHLVIRLAVTGGRARRSCAGWSDGREVEVRLSEREGGGCVWRSGRGGGHIHTRAHRLEFIVQKRPITRRGAGGVDSVTLSIKK